MYRTVTIDAFTIDPSTSTKTVGANLIGWTNTDYRFWYKLEEFFEKNKNDNDEEFGPIESCNYLANAGNEAHSNMAMYIQHRNSGVANSHELVVDLCRISFAGTSTGKVVCRDVAGTEKTSDRSMQLNTGRDGCENLD